VNPSTERREKCDAYEGGHAKMIGCM
jgi:hypothetical protein